MCNYCENYYICLFFCFNIPSKIIVDDDSEYTNLSNDYKEYIVYNKTINSSYYNSPYTNSYTSPCSPCSPIMQR